MRSQLQVLLINSSALGISATDIDDVLKMILIILSIIYTVVKSIKDFSDNKK